MTLPALPTRGANESAEAFLDRLMPVLTRQQQALSGPGFSFRGVLRDNQGRIVFGPDSSGNSGLWIYAPDGSLPVAPNIVQIDTQHIVDAAIETSKVRDGAIDFDKLLDGAVGEAKLANLAVGSAKIKDAAVGSAKIQDAAVVTAKIADAAIVTAKIGDAQIVTAKIADLAVNRAKIANAAIGSAQIEDAAITNAKIANLAVDDAKIAGLSAAKITTGFLDAARIAAGAITADKITIGRAGAALNADPGFLDPTAWQTDNGPPPIFTDIADGAAGTRVVQGQDTWVSGRQLIPIDPSKTYRIRCRQRGVVSNGAFYLVVRAVDASGNNIAGDGAFWAYPVIAGWNDGVWRTATGFVGAGTSRPFPSNARWMSPGVILNYLGTAGVHQAQDLRIEEVIPGDLIVNGAITTEKLAAGVLNVGNITGLGALATQNSVNLATQVFNSLPVGSVSGLGSFATVSQITTGNIAALIQSAAIGDAYISSLAASKITAGTLAAGVIYAGTISANQITTGTLNADLITVGTLKANRLELAGITSGLIQPGAITTTVQTSASSIGSISSSWGTIASATVTHNGKPVRVECSGVASVTVFSNSASAFVSVRLVRDGTPIFSLSGVVQKKGLDPLDDVGTASGNIGFTFADTSPPGTSSTYEFQIALTGTANANATGAMTVTVNRTE